MGGEVSSTFKDYTFGDLETLGSSNQSICQATKKDGQTYTAFCWDKVKAKEGNIFASNATKHLKVIRHPGIVKYFDCISSDKQIYLLTEKVRPLTKCLKPLQPVEIIAGIHEIIEAIVFLHEKCNLSHNNICLNSIFVTSEGKWKLAGMQHICSFAVLRSNFISEIKEKKSDVFPCPEDKIEDFKPSQYLGHERDAYGLANLLHELEEQFSDFKYQSNLFMEYVSTYLDIDPLIRPALKMLLCEEIFRNDYLYIRSFLEQLTMKSTQEKEEFFKTVGVKLHRIPEKVVASKLSHLLLSRLVFLDKTANKYLLPQLLSPCQERNLVPDESEPSPLFTVFTFKKFIIPRLSIILTVKDTSIRLILLRYFHHFVRLIPKSTLQHEILPKLLVGLKDTNDVLVSATLRALADMVPILGGDIVIGGSRSKLFSDALPKDEDNESRNKVIEKILPDKSSSESLKDKKDDLKDKEEDNLSKETNKTYEKPHIPSALKKSPVIQQSQLSGTSFNPQVTAKDSPQPQDWLKLENIPERSSPDGGEDPKVELHIPETEENSDEWSDWGAIESDSDENQNVSTSTENIATSSKELDQNIPEETKATLLSMSENVEKTEEAPISRLKTLTPNRDPMKLASNSSKPVAEASKSSGDVASSKVESKKHLEKKKTEFQEFDIFSTFEVSKKDDELDLFKDMQPNITKSSNAYSSFSGSELKERSAPTNVISKEKSSFAMNVESNDQIENGWGDDLEWDVLP